MISICEMIILSAITIVKCQYDYYRPDIRANELGKNIFGQPFTSNDRIMGDEIPGKAGADYPVYSEVPETGLRCDEQRYPGYYADPATACQVVTKYDNLFSPEPRLNMESLEHKDSNKASGVSITTVEAQVSEDFFNETRLVAQSLEPKELQDSQEQLDIK